MSLIPLKCDFNPDGALLKNTEIFILRFTYDGCIDIVCSSLSYKILYLNHRPFLVYGEAAQDIALKGNS